MNILPGDAEKEFSRKEHYIESLGYLIDEWKLRHPNSILVSTWNMPHDKQLIDPYNSSEKSKVEKKISILKKMDVLFFQGLADRAIANRLFSLVSSPNSMHWINDLKGTSETPDFGLTVINAGAEFTKNFRFSLCSIRKPLRYTPLLMAGDMERDKPFLQHLSEKYSLGIDESVHGTAKVEHLIHDKQKIQYYLIDHILFSKKHFKLLHSVTPNVWLGQNYLKFVILERIQE